MTEIVRFEESRIPDVHRLWARFYPARYHVDEDLLRTHTVGCPVFDWGVSSLAYRDGEPVAMALFKKAAAPSLYNGDQDLAHLSSLAFTDVDAAIDLLAPAKQMLRDRGVRHVAFGADSLHFFPGCPVDAPLLRSFLMVEGFDFGDEYVDLERDLSDYRNPFPIPEGVEIRPTVATDRDALQTFLEREFPGRWRYDVLGAFDREGPRTVVAAFEEGEVCGFALIQQEGCRVPIGGAVWRSDLGSNWGALGPIGVSTSERGRGLGNAVLGEGLAELSRRGARKTIIDWTTLVRFYGGHGFQVTRTYQAARLPLS